MEREAEKNKRSLSDKIIFGFGLLVLIYLLFEVFRVWTPRISVDPSRLLILRTVFLSILFEAFPFVLIGIFVSSAIQVLVPSSVFDRVFSKNKALGFAAALFAGLLFPVCDCATVPVAARLMKKGVPPPIAVTFLLAAPIVNPIVILSTLYAFPGYPSVAVCRVAVGLLVALLTGMLLMLLPSARPIENSKGTGAHEAHECDCCHPGTEAEGQSGFEALLTHAAEEFFEVGGYLIVGAAFSSVLQTFVPKGTMTALGSSDTLSLLLMMLAAFILSICSTSDAFIARAFAATIPISSVMGFMVLGPMLDLKNLFLLFGNLRKGFALKLVFFILLVSLLVLTAVPKLLFGWWGG